MTDYHFRTQVDMANRTCSLDECDRKHFGRGYCSMHWKKWHKYGDPLAGGRHYKTPEESFTARTQPDGECLVWTGTKNGAGYGLINVGDRVEQLAHRYAWERANGPIPDGMFLDHTCHNPSCVKVAHLRFATHKQNNENRRDIRLSVSGVRGVTWDKDRRKWVARVWNHDKVVFRQRYDTLEEAAEAARDARLRYYTHNDHDRAA